MLHYELDDNELYVAAGAYSDGLQYARTPTGLHNPYQRMMSLARARHEVVNGRFKRWGILNQVYRHQREKHGLVFGAIANITQLQLLAEEPLFDVEYRE